MSATAKPGLTSDLPITGSLVPWFASSLIVALLLTIVSAAHFVRPSAVYPTLELVQSFVVTDLVSLILGVPILVGSVELARRRRLVGLLFWPGALLFVVYHATAYVYAMPLHWPFLVHVALLTLSTYTAIGLVAAIDANAVAKQLRGRVPERLAGGVLIGLGALTVVRNLAVVSTAILDRAAMPDPVLGVAVADFVLAPAWIIGGALLWRRQALGYVGGTGLLFQGSMLFVGLILWTLLAPLNSGTPLVLVDVVVVSVMGLIFWVPFVLFLRGATKV
jgi:hypothetical protein